MRRIPVLRGSPKLHSLLLHSSDCWKKSPFSRNLVMPRGRIWAGGGECEEGRRRPSLNQYHGSICLKATWCMRCIPVLPGSPKLQSYLLHSSDRPRPLHVSIFFPFSLLMFCFFVWYSHIESARFVIIYHSCVPVHTTKRSMSRLTNPITPTDSFNTENCFIIFLQLFHDCSWCQ